ncbi:DUF3089 domain-containing protein [Portibacter lacus]|uniref:DUF3089 domain-containing protein n=1 Tax=Portibacter lacus TaxID=1099794 RepID=A0AA37SQH9_9BACT|nr:DUF3089 domain-containing protein [Portibacter lacus]GLR17839.1 hypothetical protein GCM10007940_24540 [Portibacter lacus]
MKMRLFVLLLLLTACTSVPKIPQGVFEPISDKGAPDYSDLKYWAASPLKKDNADRTPGDIYKDHQDEADVDVFFLHPTSYTREKGNTEWNAELDDEELNEKTDNGTILFQASVFNGAAKVYAPRYRQAHIYVFYNEDEQKKADAKKAMKLAYQDIRNAFKYYLKNLNNGRPIIIASHSQGTIHAIQLMNEFFEGKPLKEQLVAAYLIGMPVRKSSFPTIPACESADETGCFVTWRSYQRGYLPAWHESGSDIVVTNPLSWSTDTTLVPAEENKGTVLFKFNKGVKPGIADAQVYEDHLWVTKPKFRGSVFLTFKNYHIADYNLFYADIRENVQDRVKAYLDKEN